MTAAAQKPPTKTTAPSATKKIRGATDNESYREGFYFLLKIVKLLALVMVGAVCFALYMADSHQPQDSYYAENYEGKFRPMYAFDEPIISQPALLEWAASAATEIMTFGFSDYDNRIYNSRFYFTPTGWVKFAPAIMGSPILRAVTQSQQIIVAIPKQTPTLLTEGVEKGKYTWRVEVPLLLSIRAGSNQKTEYMNVNLEIVKVPTTEMPAGLGIELWTSY